MPRTAAKDKLLSATWNRSVRQRMDNWYRQHARDLPWRRTRDPYAVWISEIMLQQTQVATVERYFLKFLAAFPTISKLAAAPEEQVMRQWEGLGYYRRARQLHAAAKAIIAEQGGRFPSEMDSLRRLPGIGRYTAGAILSIAFDIPAPILEANTVRLLCRLLAFRGDTASSKGQQLLWRAAEEILPEHGCGQFNQALMELGSLICTPRSPRCNQCPLESLCPTNRQGMQERIPAPRRKPVVEDRREAAMVIVRRGRVLIRKCGTGERWAGLWDFPRFSVNRKKSGRGERNNANALIRTVKQRIALTIKRPKQFLTLRHSVTRYRIMLDCYHAQCDGSCRRQNAVTSNHCHAELRWVKPEELDDYPLNTTGRKMARTWREHARV